MRGALDKLYLWSGYLAGLNLIITFAIMIVMSVGRGFALNIPDGTYFASWSMAALAFLGMAHTFKRGEMIRVGLLMEKLKGTPKQIAEILALSVALAFMLYFTWHAIDFAYTSWRLHDMSDGVLPIPLWIPQLSFVLGASILTIAVLDEWVHVLRGNPPSFEKPPPKTTEELLARVTEGGGV
jgi:TRAP-type C4-dicarboxylate transport system permease small subunit